VAIAADAAQLGGWRQHDYVRCPDIGYLIHREAALLPSINHPFVKETTAALSRNQNNANWLDESHTILSVTAMLAHLNFDYRFKQPRIAPSLSWSVVRAVQGETDSRFWHVLLKALGASDLAIKEHFLRSDTLYTTTLIWSILSGGTVAQKLGCSAAPDLVVVFAAKHLRREGMAKADRELLQLDAERVIEQINKMSFEALRKPYRDVIGRSRIVLLDSDMTIQNRPYFNALNGADSDRDKLFAALSIFELGFTLQMAQIAVGDLTANIVHLKSQLNKHVEAGTLWRHGEHYFLPHALRLRGSMPASLDLAKTLKRIANSLMPGLGGSSAGGLAVADCFEAEHCREAQAYLVKARDVADTAMAIPKHEADREKLETLKHTVNCERDLHQRFFEMPTWGVLTNLNKNPNTMSRREVLQYAHNLMDQARASGNLKPNGYTMVIKSTENLLRDVWNKIRALKKTSLVDTAPAKMLENGRNLAAWYNEVKLLFNEIERLFDEAEHIAETQGSDRARKDWLVHVLTRRYGCLRAIGEFARGEITKRLKFPEKQKLADIDRRLLEIFEDGEDYGIFPNSSWFIEHGDRAIGVTEATRFYRRALHHSPAFLEIYPRIFGILNRAEYREAMQTAPGLPYWKAKVVEALAWIERDIERLKKRTFSGQGSERFWKGYKEMQRFMGI
jgi:hypothetical protein